MVVEAVAAQSTQSSGGGLPAGRALEDNAGGFANLLLQNVATLGQDQTDVDAMSLPANDGGTDRTKSPSSRRVTGGQLNSLQNAQTATSFGTTSDATFSAAQAASFQPDFAQAGVETSAARVRQQSATGQQQPSRQDGDPSFGASRTTVTASHSAPGTSAGVRSTTDVRSSRSSDKTSHKRQDDDTASASQTANSVAQDSSTQTPPAQQAAAAAAAQTAPPPSTPDNADAAAPSTAPAGTTVGPADPAQPAPDLSARTPASGTTAPAQPATPGQAANDAAAQDPSAASDTTGQSAGGQSAGGLSAANSAAGQSPQAAGTASAPAAAQADTDAQTQSSTTEPQSSVGGDTAAAQAAALSQIAGSTRVNVKTAAKDATAATEVPQQSASQLAPAAATVAQSTTQTSSGDTQPATQSVDPSLTATPVAASTGGQAGTAAFSGEQAADGGHGGSSDSTGAGEPSTRGFAAETAALKDGGSATGAVALNTQVSSMPVAGAEVKIAPTVEAVAAMPGTVVSLSQAQETSATSPAQSVRQPVQPSPIDQIKVQLGKSLKDGTDTLSLQLHPADLGRVDIKLEMQNGQVKATVTADRPETLQMLKNDAGSLQQSLNNAGLSTDSNSLNFQLRGEQQDRQAAQNGQQGGNASLLSDETDMEEDDGLGATQSLAALSQNYDPSDGLDINV